MKLRAFLIVAGLSLLAVSCQKENTALMLDPLAELTLRSAYPDVIELPLGYQPEGIAIGKQHTAYVGSIYSGAIWKADLQTGAGEYLVAPGVANPNIGLAYDKRSDYIFAAGGYLGSVKVFDANTGELVAYYQLVPPGPYGTTWVNDLVVTKDAVYVTDSFRPFMHKIPLGPAGQLPEQADVQEIALAGDWIPNPAPG
ncbi:MAG: hypothetical protein R3330_15845, partial [Saprospiraceae bacterium]|nr:hypothetical protein [Saprospiraceae bacterium]